MYDLRNKMKVCLEPKVWPNLLLYIESCYVTEVVSAACLNLSVLLVLPVSVSL